MWNQYQSRNILITISVMLLHAEVQKVFHFIRPNAYIQKELTATFICA
jgi:hypothetical protein